MPSLDTLDLSHNKIKRLPPRPGELLKLKVDIPLSTPVISKLVSIGVLSIAQQDYKASRVYLKVPEAISARTGT